MTDTATPKTWKRFLTRQLPGAVLALALLAEALAFMLDGVALRRHDLDLLALNVQRTAPKPSPKTVLIGDSVTQDIIKTYAIGRPGTVANLTTNMASGLVGAYLLLKRYTAAGARPQHLVIASTPEFFTFHPQGETARTYVTSVFRDSAEIAYLDTVMTGPPPPYEPAILQMDNRLGLKALALLAPKPDGLLMGSREPDPGQSATPRDVPPPLQDAFEIRGRAPLSIPATNVRILGDICALARTYNMTVHIQNAPVAYSTYRLWQKNATLKTFEGQRADVLQTVCADVSVTVGGDTPQVPDGAMRDSDHLVRHDWTNVYAVKLNALVNGLP